jgi:hypothetical protein
MSETKMAQRLHVGVVLLESAVKSRMGLFELGRGHQGMQFERLTIIAWRPA